MVLHLDASELLDDCLPHSAGFAHDIEIIQGWFVLKENGENSCPCFDVFRLGEEETHGETGRLPAFVHQTECERLCELVAGRVEPGTLGTGDGGRILTSGCDFNRNSQGMTRKTGPWGAV